MTSYLFNNKKKNAFIIITLVAQIVITLVNFLLGFLGMELVNKEFGFLMKAIFNSIPSLILSLLPSIVFILHFVFLNKKSKIKQFFVPVYFAYSAIYATLVVISSAQSLFLFGSLNSETAITYFSSFFLNLGSLTAFIFLFIGSLNNFKFPKLFRTGALINIIYIICLVLSGFINATSMPSFSNYNNLLAHINLVSLIKLIVLILFYLSLFLLTFNKKEEAVEATTETPQTNE